MDYDLGKRLDNIEEMLYALCVAANVIKQKEEPAKAEPDKQQIKQGEKHGTV